MIDQAPPPSMSHTAAYYEYQRSSNPASPAYHYPQHPTLARLPTAYASHWHNPVHVDRGDGTYMKPSASSDTTGSSSVSDSKTYLPPHRYLFGTQAERGLMGKPSGSRSGETPRNDDINGGPTIRQEMVEDHSAVIRYVHHDDQDDEPEERDHGIWILFWLSLLDPLHSMFSCIYSIFTLLGLIILSPVRLLRRGESFGTTLIRSIAPVFRYHLHMIYAPSVKKAHTFDFSPVALILIHIASPFVSLILAFCAWIAAVFWLFALIMGNPDGTEKRDDGRATVLGLRNYMERYLLNALRDTP